MTIAAKDDPIANAVAQAKRRTSGEALQHWVPRLEALLAADGHQQTTVDDLSLPGDGGSSGTVLFTAHRGDGMSERLVLRFKPESGHAHESDIAGQYRILCALQQTDVPSPRVLGFDECGQYLGVPGFLMRCIDGTALPSTYPVNGPLFEATPATRGQMIGDAIAALAKIHRVDWRSFGLDKISRQGNGANWLERDLDWYLTALRWGSPEAEAAIRAPLQWLLANQFEPTVVALGHGDSSLHNYMYKDGRLVGVLDWEYAFIGAPEVDLAFQTSAHDILCLDRPPLEGVPDALHRCAIYERLAGRQLDQWSYYLTVGRLKLYVHMALAFRGLPPEMAPMRDKYVGYALERLMDTWDAAKR